ncbi:MAG: hypothetical protein FK734_03965, partial [Asgard group archaeon]|nr:hypothetical protein [Asgard group archaeon]
MIKTQMNRFIALMLLSSFLFFVPTMNCISLKINNNQISTNCDDFPIILEYWPIDLDYLFFADNLTAQQERLDILAETGNFWFISPYGGHFVSSHIEGNTKFYLTPFRLAKVNAPNEGFIEAINIDTLDIRTVDDQEVVYNTNTDIKIQGYGMTIANVDLLKSIYDEFQATGTY